MRPLCRRLAAACTLLLLTTGASAANGDAQVSSDARVSGAEPRAYYSLEELTANNGGNKPAKDDEETIRLESMRDEALDAGVVNGYGYQMEALTKIILHNEDLWRRLLPFDYVANIAADLNATKGKFLIPGVVDVVTNTGVATNLDEDAELRIEGTTYFLRKKPRLALRQPNWKDYLIDSEQPVPSLPAETLWPRTNDEMASYNKWIKEGWARGVEQANEEMQHRIRNAFRDVIGMVRYINLVEARKISSPLISVSNVAVINRGNEMAVDNMIIQIQESVEFIDDTSVWEMPSISGRDSVRKELTILRENRAVTEQEITEAINNPRMHPAHPEDL